MRHAPFLYVAWSAVAVAASSSSARAADPKPVVAVFDIDRRQAVALDGKVSFALTDNIATTLTASGKYVVVARAANKTAATTISKVGNTCLVAIKLFDLRTSATEAAGRGRGPCTEEAILASVDQALAELLGGATEKPVMVPFSGTWLTSTGRMSLRQDGDRVTGTHVDDGGEVFGVAVGNTMDGFWIEDGSGQRCAAPKNGRHHWGRLVITLAADNTFDARWGYCDAEPTKRGWSGVSLAPADLERLRARAGGFDGKWSTSNGETTLAQSGDDVTGRYTSDKGEIVGVASGGVMDGYWIEDDSNQRCDVAKNGRKHWGRIAIRLLPNGDFIANWSYCDAEPTRGAWDGKRL